MSTLSEKEFLAIAIGKAIKKQRQSFKITQQELAARCDFEKSNMSRIESGRTNITLWNLQKIANALEVNIVDLLRLAEEFKQ